MANNNRVDAIAISKYMNGGNGDTAVNTTKQMSAEVLKKVSIPTYFKAIIEPQLPGYFDLYPVNFDGDPRACCPLHDEDTPSFRYYEDTASFYCFGCQKGGNIINLHKYFAERMTGTPISRDDAITFLYDYFIRKKDQLDIPQIPVKVVEEKEKEQDTVALLRYNRYKTQTEQCISFDNSIPQDVKRQAWRIFDDVDVLVSKNIISAEDGMKYIKRELIKYNL